VRVLADALGEDVRVNQISREQWKQSLSKYLSDEYGEALLDYWRGLAEHPALISPAVSGITGRPATPFRTWTTRNLPSLRP
jgi:hypothetical protein